MPRVRFARTELAVPKKNLSQRIDEMDKDESKKFDEEIARSYCCKARVAREGDSASLSCTAAEWRKNYQPGWSIRHWMYSSGDNHSRGRRIEDGDRTTKRSK